MPKTDKIPDKVKKVYNDHLIYTKTFHRKPFTKRKNFEGFEDDNRYKHYHQLAIWFEQHPEINRKMYFEAYLHFNPKKSAIPIKYYVRPSALTLYAKYRRLIESMDLGDSNILRKAVDSFKYVRDYCEDKQIKLDEYPTFREKDHVSYAWCKHVKEGNVFLYILFGFSGFFNILKDLYKDVEVWNFYIGDETPFFFLRRWHTSTRFQTLANKAITKIKQNK